MFHETFRLFFGFGLFFFFLSTPRNKRRQLQRSVCDSHNAFGPPVAAGEVTREAAALSGLMSCGGGGAFQAQASGRTWKKEEEADRGEAATHTFATRSH